MHIAKIILVLWLGTLAACAATVEANVVAPTGGDYTTLANWENGEDDTGDLVSRDVISIAVIQGTWSTEDYANVSISGWTTDATRYIVITNSTSKHSGAWSTTAYRLCVTNAAALSISEDFVHVKGIMIRLTLKTGASAAAGINVSGQGAGATITITDVILRSMYGDAVTSHAILVNDSDVVFGATNSVCYNFTNNTGNGFYALAASTAYFYNCTAFKNSVGFRRTAGTVVLTNCIASENANNYSGTLTGDYNLASDADADTPGTTTYKSKDVVFANETYDSEDLHLSASDTEATGKGFDLSSFFTLDFEGSSRPTGAGTWDLGADEYVATGTAPPWRVKFLRGIRR